MSENCGPLHEGCECEVECPDCGGGLLWTEHECGCPKCTFTDEDAACMNERCTWKGEEYQTSAVNTHFKASETKRLAAWTNWAAGVQA